MTELADQRQPALPFQVRVYDTLDSFFPGNSARSANAKALAAVRKLVADVGPTRGPERWLYLWGPAASGKTHLLNAACQAATPLSVRCGLISPDPELVRGSESLRGLEQLDLVCIDGVDNISGNALWEAALFTLLNESLDGATRLLITARVPPAKLGVRLPDLASRLAWGLTLPLTTLSQNDLVEALCKRARAMGLAMPDAVARYLLRYARRDFASLIELTERLDSSALAAQRRLTIPFVRDFLNNDGRTD